MTPANGRHRLSVTLAVNDYDHVRDLCSGVVPIEGVALNCLHFSVEEIFYRFPRFREWDVSELSLAKYCSLRASGDDSLVAIPVFTSRAFRHSAIFVRADGPVDDPAELAGGRIGVPEWTQTATVYGRGLLAHDYGVATEDVTWIQAGTNEPGRTEGVSIELPDRIRVTAVPDRTLNDMLLDGELDAVIAAHPPSGFKRGDGAIVRLFSDYREVERESFARSGVFPIMHVIAMRAEVHERNPWLATNLYSAFEAAKQRSLARMVEVNAPFLPIPWAPAHALDARATFGEDPWPYGVDANRATLETFLDYAAEQSVCARRMDPEELFLPQVQHAFRI